MRFKFVAAFRAGIANSGARAGRRYAPFDGDA